MSKIGLVFSQSFGMGKETFKRHFHYEGILIKYQIGLIRCTVKFFFSEKPKSKSLKVLLFWKCC